MNIKNIEKIIDAISKSDFSEFSIKSKSFEIYLKKNFYSDSNTNLNVKNDEIEIKNSSSNKILKKIKIIKSPIVGTFYNSPSPDSEPFVNLGCQVDKNSTVGIIESMKVMNEIFSGFVGKISKILVKNGEVVEYDQPLFEIE